MAMSNNRIYLRLHIIFKMVIDYRGHGRAILRYGRPFEAPRAPFSPNSSIMYAPGYFSLTKGNLGVH